MSAASVRPRSARPSRQARKRNPSSPHVKSSVTPRASAPPEADCQCRQYFCIIVLGVTSPCFHLLWYRLVRRRNVAVAVANRAARLPRHEARVRPRPSAPDDKQGPARSQRPRDLFTQPRPHAPDERVGAAGTRDEIALAGGALELSGPAQPVGSARRQRRRRTVNRGEAPATKRQLHELGPDISAHPRRSLAPQR